VCLCGASGGMIPYDSWSVELDSLSDVFIRMWRGMVFDVLRT
jgi:hypothetical protein